MTCYGSAYVLSIAPVTFHINRFSVAILMALSSTAFLREHLMLAPMKQLHIRHHQGLCCLERIFSYCSNLHDLPWLYSLFMFMADWELPFAVFVSFIQTWRERKTRAPLGELAPSSWECDTSSNYSGDSWNTMGEGPCYNTSKLNVLL